MVKLLMVLYTEKLAVDMPRDADTSGIKTPMGLANTLTTPI